MTDFIFRGQVRNILGKSTVSRAAFSAVMTFFPWFMYVVVLGFFSFFPKNTGTGYDNSGIIIFEYNILFSLLFSAPLCIAVGRAMVRMKDAYDVGKENAMLALMFLLCAVTGIFSGGVFYYFYKDMAETETIMGYINYMMFGMLWGVLSFLPSVRRGRRFLFVFLIGLCILLFVLGRMYPVIKSVGFLLGLNVGLTFFIFSFAGLFIKNNSFVFRDFTDCLRYAASDLKIAGIAYLMFAGIFADKIVAKLSSAHFLGKTVEHFFICENASFSSLVTAIPVIICELFFFMFLFPGRYRKFLKIIKEHGVLVYIKKAEKMLLRLLIDFFGSLIIFQGAIAVICILGVSWIMSFTGNDIMVDADIFQYGVLTVYLQSMTFFLCVVFVFFGLIKPLFITSLVYAIASLSANVYFIIELGVNNGTGSLLASVAAFITAFMLTTVYSGKIAYLTFRNYAERL